MHVKAIPQTKSLQKLLFGTLLLILSSWIRIPCYPVSFTGHTLALMVLALFQPPKIACGSALCYLGLATLGAPVFAGIARPLWYLGNSAGFLAAFPLATFLMAFLSKKIPPTLALVAGHLVLYLFGFLHLMTLIGPYKALIHGVVVFLPTAIIKIIIAQKIRSSL